MDLLISMNDVSKSTSALDLHEFGLMPKMSMTVTGHDMGMTNKSLMPLAFV